MDSSSNQDQNIEDSTFAEVAVGASVIRGRSERGIYSFKGIRYAAPIGWALDLEDIYFQKVILCEEDKYGTSYEFLVGISSGGKPILKYGVPE